MIIHLRHSRYLRHSRENGNLETCPSQAGLFAKPMVDSKNKDRYDQSLDSPAAAGE